MAKVKLDLLTDSDILWMAEKGIRGGICWCTKSNYKYVKDYDKNKELSYLQFWDINNYGKNKELSYFQYWDVNNLLVEQFGRSFQ